MTVKINLILIGMNMNQDKPNLDKHEILNLIADRLALAEMNFIQLFINKYGKDRQLLAEDIANEIFGYPAGVEFKISNILRQALTDE